MHFDHALCMAAYLSQNLVPQVCKSTYQHLVFCADLRLEFWWEDNSSPLRGIIKNNGTQDQQIHQLDQGPDGGLNNRSTGILNGLWLETKGNVHHW